MVVLLILLFIMPRYNQKDANKSDQKQQIHMAEDKYWDFTGSSVVLWVPQLQVKSLRVPERTACFANPA